MALRKTGLSSLASKNPTAAYSLLPLHRPHHLYSQRLGLNAVVSTPAAKATVTPVDAPFDDAA